MKGDIGHYRFHQVEEQDGRRVAIFALVDADDEDVNIAISEAEIAQFLGIYGRARLKQFAIASAALAEMRAVDEMTTVKPRPKRKPRPEEWGSW